MGKNQSPKTGDLRVARVLNLVVFSLLIIALGALALTWPNSQRLSADRSGSSQIEARVDSTSDCSLSSIDCTIVDIVPTEGPDIGQIFRLPPLEGIEVGLSPGDRIMVEVDLDATAAERYSFSDQVRLPWLALLSVLFVIIAAIVARVHGVRAVAALAVSVVILGTYTLPSIYEGSSPVLVGAATSVILSFVILFTSGGPTEEAKTAFLSTVASISITGIVGELAFSMAKFNGSGTASLFALTGIANVEGLLLAGLMIGATGLVCGAALRQSRLTVSCRQRFPSWSNRQVYSHCASQARSDLGGSLSTLFLAYAGASLPLLVLFVASDLPPELAANSEVVAVEIVRALVGSLGLLLVTPLATALTVGMHRTPSPTIDLTNEVIDLEAIDDSVQPPVERTIWERLRQGLDD